LPSKKQNRLKRVFYIGITGLALFEVLKVFFIMPMPGSQGIDSVDLAYFLHTWRWPFRLVFALLIISGAFAAYRAKRWLMLASLIACLFVAWAFNFKMAADAMFYQPTRMLHAASGDNKIPLEKLVIGIERNGESRAYPIQLIAYHHQVLDTLSGEPIMVTYCSVCRTGRIYEPKVNGSPETFRLVGMDHFNAMFEDAHTGSWWRQVNGEAIAGPLKGTLLPELPGEQTTLEKWLERYPQSLVMQHDSTFIEEYEDLDDYDFGVERGDLTRTDTLSWKEKSWVVGLVEGDSSRAIDWNELKRRRIINLRLGGKPVVVVLAADDQSFYAYRRPGEGYLTVENDILHYGGNAYTLWGDPLTDSVPRLKKVKAYQEFWHSWRTFHPDTGY
jgi:uncharacterized integral membrane protein